MKISAEGAYIFSNGWRSLARDHELQDGDACAFEASTSEGRVTLSVHPLQGSYNPPGDATLSLHCTFQPSTFVSVVNSECLISDGDSQCFGAKTSSESGASAPLELDIHSGYMVSKHTNLTPEQKKRVLEKLREIQAKTFVFVTAKKRGNDSLVSPVQYHFFSPQIQFFQTSSA